MKKNTVATSHSNGNNENQSVIPEIREAGIVRFAPDSPETPVTVVDGIAVKGTALAVFIGYKHSSMDWTETNEANEKTNKSVAKLALVFGLLQTNGQLKTVVSLLPYVVGGKSGLTIALNALQITPETIMSEAPPESPLHGTFWGVKEIIDGVKVRADLDLLKGLSFMVEAESKSKNNKYYYELDYPTMQPFMKGNEHVRLKKAEDCDVSSYKIKFD